MIENGKIIAIAATERDLTTHNRLFASFKDLPRRIIMAQENEKSRISQILHSEFGQALIALKLFTVISSSNLDKKNDLMRTVLDKIRNNLDTIINDTRNLAHELSPPGLKYAGLVPAIKGLIDSATSKEKLQIRFFHRNMDQACFKEKDIIIYRILQEAIQNILKHSQATRARVSAVLSKTNFILEISDNGKGFDSTVKSSSQGLGLALMSQQALLIRGRLSIESHAGKGTLLKITVPIKEKK
jgi:two-component system sensor histidine kinase DegS